MTSTVLYRHFDAAGRLLYVGISLRPFARLSAHRMVSSWFGEIATITLEHHRSRIAAEMAEACAIAAEAPLHNRAGVPPLPEPAKATPEERAAMLRRHGMRTEDEVALLFGVSVETLRRKPRDMLPEFKRVPGYGRVFADDAIREFLTSKPALRRRKAKKRAAEPGAIFGGA